MLLFGGPFSNPGPSCFDPASTGFLALLLIFSVADEGPQNCVAMVLVPTSSTTKASRLAQQQPVRLQPSRHMPTSQQLRGTWRCRPMVRPEGSGAQRKAGIARPCCAAFESGILRPELMPAEAPLVPQAAGERPSARSWAWSPAAVDMRFSWHWLKSHSCTCALALLSDSWPLPWLHQAVHKVCYLPDRGSSTSLQEAIH